jgi:hypothetical protein
MFFRKHMCRKECVDDLDDVWSTNFPNDKFATFQLIGGGCMSARFVKSFEQKNVPQ